MRRNFEPMDKDIEEFYATIPDGEYPVSEIQKMKPHPLRVSIEPKPEKEKIKKLTFKGKAVKSGPVKRELKPSIESHGAADMLMVFEGGKLVAFRYPDGTLRKVTRLHTEDDRD